MNKNIISEAHNRAIKIIKKCIHPAGLKASARENGYTQIWARDSMISLLGAALIEDSDIKEALINSINTLREHKSENGCIPNNVDTVTGKTDYKAYADGGLWFVIGNYFLSSIYRNRDLLAANYGIIKEVLNWHKYQDPDGTGFLTMSEAADWEDLLAVRGKGLYVNVLYNIALRCASLIAEQMNDEENASMYFKKSRDISSLINRHFWYNGDGNIIPNIELYNNNPQFNKEGYDRLGRERILPEKSILHDYCYYLPYLTFRNFGEWFDSFGNLLCILSGLASREQSSEIIKLIDTFKLAEPFPVKAIYPPLQPDEPDWRYYYQFGNLNLPNQYHNGGIWPFLGGFYVSALVFLGEYRRAEEELDKLARANEKGVNNEWEFNEWLHGETGKPMGMAEQAWSASLFIFAERAVRERKVPFFEYLK